MRFLFELGVFGVIAGIAFVMVFGVTLALGSPLGLDVRGAALLAGLILVFWLPAFGNVHIAVSGHDESPRARVCAGVRAFGMLLSSAVLTAPVVTSGFSWWLGGPLLLVGQVCWWGSCLFESRRQAEPVVLPSSRRR